MVSDKMPRGSVPSTQELSRPEIPSRSSSISRTSRRNVRDRRSETFRHSMIVDSGHHSDLFLGDLTSENTMSDQRRAMRASSPLRTNGRSASCSAPLRKTMESVAKVQRWAGLTRSVCNWDGLRKDPELWVQDGDCYVHLYERGASRRGPSFCVPLRSLRQRNCDGMLSSCFAQTYSESSPEPQQLRSFSGLQRGSTLVELYIPAPEFASRGEAFDWHITTRNFFAYILGQPLVGRHMGQTFVDLYERMQLFRFDVNNHQDFLAYAENQGYRDLVECTDYALASLYYAERYKLRDVWIDAFTHCVGMGDSIALSPEYMPISRLTKALITRAYLEVDIHLNRVTKALGTFLQDDFSPAYLGLPQGARNHLYRFQRFLHDFYTAKFGHWPPPSSAASFPKTLYKSMFNDFKSLYDLLVEYQSCNDIASQKPASGGICVLQNVAHFDKRHKFTTQMHPLPLLPNDLGHDKPTRSLSSASYIRKSRDTSAALALATNILDADTSNSKIIQAYTQFERTSAVSSAPREDRLSVIDARKIRWLLIYGTLQYLTSALRAPSAVRDVESPEYPLCCLVAGQSSWKVGTPAATSPIRSPMSGIGAINDYFEGAQTPSIQPDCQREDYITSDNSSRRGSVDLSSKAQLPARQPSMRSFGPLSSLSVRGSRRNSLALKPPPHCTIIVQGYGDGLNQAMTETSNHNSRAHEDVPESSSGPFLLEDTDDETSWLQPQPLYLPTSNVTPNIEPRGHTRNRTPLLHTFQLDQMATPPVTAQPTAETTSDSMSRSDSTSSMGSSVWTDGGSAASSKSSANGERHCVYKTSTAEHSGLLGGLVSVDGTRVSLEMPETRTSTSSPSQADIHPLFREAPQQQDGFVFDFSTQRSQKTTPTPTTGSVGMAFSVPPSPALHPTPSQIEAALSKMALASERKAPSIRTSSFKEDAAPRKKVRSSDIFSNMITAPTDLRDRYNSAIKRLEIPNPNVKSFQYGDLCNGAKSNAQTPTVTKTSHASKTSSPRNRIWHDDGKIERRMSSLWRR